MTVDTVWIVFEDRWNFYIQAICNSEKDAQEWIENHPSSLFDLFYQEYKVGGKYYNDDDNDDEN